MYNASQIKVDNRLFPQSTKYQWNNFYPDDKELLPPNMPRPRDLFMNIRTYLDTFHNGNLVTWMFHTGI